MRAHEHGTKEASEPTQPWGSHLGEGGVHGGVDDSEEEVAVGVRNQGVEPPSHKRDFPSQGGEELERLQKDLGHRSHCGVLRGGNAIAHCLWWK